MKTADSIEQQEERKAARDNGNDEPSLPELTQPVTQKHKRGDASYTARIAPWRFKPGNSGNPGGKPKHDIAKEIAQAIFLNNADMIYAAYTKMLRRGNAYAFQVLSDRAFGKLKERHEVEVGPFHELSDQELREKIKKLETELGIQSAEPDPLPQPSEPKLN